MAITIRKIPSPSGSISNSDNSYTASVVSGGSLELPDITISNSDNSYSVTTSSVQNINLPDENITVNGTAFITKPSLKNQDISLVDQDDNTLTPTLSGSNITVDTSPQWERPTDWLAMPSVSSSDDTFVGLHAIFPSGNNFAAFRFTTSTGDYQVDWGDGTVDTVASNVVAEHTYDYSTYDTGNSTLSSRGYKQAIIVVTPLTGNLTTANFDLRRTTTPSQTTTYATGFLDCILSMPYANIAQSIVFGGAVVSHRYCERFNLLNLGNASILTNIFMNCSSLQEVPLFDTSNVQGMLQMFRFCSSLQKVPLFDTSNVSNMSYMFSGCRSLQEIPFFDTSNVTSMVGTFQQCYSLQEIPFFDTSNVTSMITMFENCSSLQTIPNFNTPNLTNVDSMFDGCVSLQKVPLFDTSNVTNMFQFFANCSSLNELPAFDTTNNTNCGQIAYLCFSLDRTDIIGRTTIDFRSCQLSQSELVNIFNNLIDRSSTTSANIYIAGNWGVSALTAAERQIATDKNWVIIG